MSRLIGRSVPRLEDARLVVGKGRYTDDLTPPDACWAFVVRAPHGHALVTSIKTAAASAAPGVLAVLTAADYVADGLRPIAHAANPPDALDVDAPSFMAEAGLPLFEHPQMPLIGDVVRYVGEGVALVVAETADQARDAGELVDVKYEVLPAVASPIAGVAEDAPQLWPNVARNVALDRHLGDEAAVNQAFDAAHLVVERDFYNQRVVNCQMEPRAAFAFYDADKDAYTIFAGSQGVMRQRLSMADALGTDKNRVRLISPDVGGGFGPRTSLNPEAVLVAWASKRVGRPVRWLSDRSEAFLTDYQGRDLFTRAGLAFGREGGILGMRVEQYGNLGAYPVSFAPLANGYRIISTVYHVPAASVRIRGVLTNTTPTSPYRGAGRPEATFAIERLIDIAAARLGIERVELRRRNMIPREALPYRNVMGLTYDSGDFHGNMDEALRRAEWSRFDERRASSRMAGRLRGIGVANYIEAPVGAARERIEVRVLGAGLVEIVSGTQASGQGHETTFGQVVADLLGVGLDRVKLVTGDTNVVQLGGGTHSDRSMRLAGTLLFEACAAIETRAREIAAFLLDADSSELKFEKGCFEARQGGRSVGLFEVARALELRANLPTQLAGPLSATADISRRIPAHPTGCAVCELEVDPETGWVEVLRYTTVDDVGQAINPQIVDGQVHGGIAQGVGQALYESHVVDASTGQVSSASFLDYALPRADVLPTFDVHLAEDPTSGNPLRIKGAGEGGITPATAAVINALVDALGAFGIDHIEMPATPQRIWAAIRARRTVATRSFRGSN